MEYRLCYSWGYLSAGFLVRAERSLEHQDAVPVQPQLDGFPRSQLSSYGRGLNKGLPFPGQEV